MDGIRTGDLWCGNNCPNKCVTTATNTYLLFVSSKFYFVNTKLLLLFRTFFLFMTRCVSNPSFQLQLSLSNTHTHNIHINNKQKLWIHRQNFGAFMFMLWDVKNVSWERERERENRTESRFISKHEMLNDCNHVTGTTTVFFHLEYTFTDESKMCFFKKCSKL